jgi:hypothetical protein
MVDKLRRMHGDQLDPRRNRAHLEIAHSNLILYGKVIGCNPTASQVMNALLHEADRVFLKRDSTRELRIVDAIGFWMQSERRSEKVLSLGFDFAAPSWRPPNEQDPKAFFQGTIRIGDTMLSTPISRPLVDKVAMPKLANISHFFTYDGPLVIGITVSFPAMSQLT